MNSPAQTAGRILDAATKLFIQKPFEEVHLEEVALTAEVSKATLHKYFETKDRLYLRVLEQLGDQYLKKIEQAVKGLQDGRGRVLALVRTALAFFRRHPNLMKLLDRAGIDCNRQAHSFPWLRVQQRLFEMVQSFFGDGIGQGEFTLADPEMAIRALLGAMRFALLYPCEEDNPGRLPERIVDVVLRPPFSSASQVA